MVDSIPMEEEVRLSPISILYSSKCIICWPNNQKYALWKDYLGLHKKGKGNLNDMQKMLRISWLVINFLFNACLTFHAPDHKPPF